MPSEKPTARSYSASVKTTTGLSPLQWGDKCFLCGNTIAEGSGEGFYQSKKGGFYRCHRGCINIMDSAGGHPRDFHRVKGELEGRKAPVHDEPVHQDIEARKLQVEFEADELPPQQYNGPRTIKFADLQRLQSYTAVRGPIPDHVRVFIGDYVVQAGGSY